MGELSDVGVDLLAAAIIQKLEFNCVETGNLLRDLDMMPMISPLYKPILVDKIYCVNCRSIHILTSCVRIPYVSECSDCTTSLITIEADTYKGTTIYNYVNKALPPAMQVRIHLEILRRTQGK